MHKSLKNLSEGSKKYLPLPRTNQSTVEATRRIEDKAIRTLARLPRTNQSTAVRLERMEVGNLFQVAWRPSPRSDLA